MILAAVVSYLAVGLAVWLTMHAFLDMSEDRLRLAIWTVAAWPLMVLTLGADSGWEWFPLTLLSLCVGLGVVIASAALA